MGSSSMPLYDVHYGNNTFVTVGKWGSVLISSDGSNWTVKNHACIQNKNYFDYSANLKKVTYGNGLFITVGPYTNGVNLFSSSNASDWDKRNAFSGTQVQSWENKDLNQIAFFEGKFITTGNGPNMWSNDGINWNNFNGTSWYNPNDTIPGNIYYSE
jgi:hypothetical protein